jgi:pimeloyl-ACP methyl ester carboxylesterase
MKTRILLPLIALVLLAAACTSQSDSTTTTTTDGFDAAEPTEATTTTSHDGTTTTAGGAATAGYEPMFEEGDCTFTPPMGYDPSCGYLVVPESRDDPDGAMVKVAVAVFPSTAETPASDPLVYLEGGPGGNILDALQFDFGNRFGPFLAERDVIIFDQRGVGQSMPSLDCPEMRELQIELLDDALTAEEYNDAEAPAVAACQSRLASEGVDLAAYNSESNAADVADLRVALGIDEWNLYGISYGTRLALTTMRDHPEGIRSVILDSTVPLQSDLYEEGPANAQRAFDTFFAGCDADADCAAAFPELENRFYALVDQFNAAPIDIEVDNALTGESYPGRMRGDDMVGFVFQSLYSEEIIPILPDIIADAEAGEYTGLSRLASISFVNGDFITTGMYLSVQCNEEVAFTSVAAAEEAAAAYPDVGPIWADADGEFAECGIWGAGAADPIEDEAVVSGIPTLVVAGQYDPITPPSWGVLAAETLDTSYFYEFPGLGHGVTTGDDCAQSIALEFLSDPAVAPDGTCVTTLGGPDFYIPGAPVQVTLVPFETDFFGVTLTSVAPEEWSDQGFGAYTAPGLGDSGIIQQALPSGFITTEALAETFAEQFGLEGDWDTSSYNEAREWTIYTAEDGGAIYDVGLAEDGDIILVVILLSTPDTRDDYYELVFIPALEAVQATQ